jgi:energy-coupling factor transporter ATP-binding protein EcfA2
MSSIKIRNLSFSWPDKRKVLDRINLDVESGSIFGLFGRNGSGKTTLAYCMSGLIPREIEGELSGSVKAGRAGIVFQNPDVQFFSDLVQEEIELGPEWLGLQNKEKIVNEVLKELEIENLRERELRTLSDGEKKKVAIAAILATKPDILILDEPLLGLDRPGIHSVIEVIKRIKKEGRTIIIIEQLTKYLRGILDHVAILHKGRIVSEGKPEVVFLKDAEKYGVRKWK